MTELSTFACKNCDCTSRGHFNVKIDTKRKERQEKQRLDRNKDSVRVSELNPKIYKKFEKECDKHNSEWNGWKGKLFPWKVEVDYPFSNHLHRTLKVYQIVGRMDLIREEPCHVFANEYTYSSNDPLNYIVCPVCKHRKYFY